VIETTETGLYPVMKYPARFCCMKGTPAAVGEGCGRHATFALMCRPMNQTIYRKCILRSAIICVVLSRTQCADRG
jgi:hypothetical protein